MGFYLISPDIEGTLTHVAGTAFVYGFDWCGVD